MEILGGSCRLGLWFVHVWWNDTMVYRIRFARTGIPGRVPDPIRHYCAGRVVNLSGLSEAATPEDTVYSRIYRAVQQVPYGSTSTYGEIACKDRDVPPGCRAGDGPQSGSPRHSLSSYRGGRRYRRIFLPPRNKRGSARDGKKRIAERSTIPLTPRIRFCLSSDLPTTWGRTGFRNGASPMRSAMVLVGGEARRARGQEKYFFTYLGRTFIERLIDSLRQVVDEIILVARDPEQCTRFSSLDGIRCITDIRMRDRTNRGAACRIPRCTGRSGLCLCLRHAVHRPEGNSISF